MDISLYKEFVGITLGKKKASLVLKNANVIMVQSGEVVKSDIAIEDGYIVGVGEYSGENEVDLKGKYVSPGFIDAHLHLESTMSNPQELINVASMKGTLTFIVDPHEAANVSGEKGINYIIDQTAKNKAGVYLMMPSCVPAKDEEENGYTISSKNMEKYLNNPRVLGLGEVMDCDAVIDCKETMLEKLQLYKDKVNDGHAIGLSDKKLSAYAMSNIKTDHESVTYDQAVSEVRNGMYVHIREGSAAKNLEAIVRGIVRNDICVDRFTFCTDDKHIEDIEKEGHISYNIRKSIQLGIKPVLAYKMATMNPAICYKLSDIGIIAPGRKANLVVLSDFEGVKVDSVMYEGEWLNNKPLTKEEIELSNKEFIEKYNYDITDTVHIDWFTKDMLDYQNDEYGIELIENELLTKKVRIDESDKKFNKAVVIERHHNTGHYKVCKLYNFGLEKGAIATSVSHDSHNIVVVGTDDSDIMEAISELKKLKGGCVVVEDGKVYESLQLPIMGLISDLESEEINRKLSKMIKKCREMGVKDGIEPFITLSFIALPVIPEIRLTTKGIFDIVEDRFL